MLEKIVDLDEINDRLIAIEKRLAKLERDSHKPYDFTKLYEELTSRLAALKMYCGVNQKL